MIITCCTHGCIKEGFEGWRAEMFWKNFSLPAPRTSLSIPPPAGVTAGRLFNKRPSRGPLLLFQGSLQPQNSHHT